VSARLTLSGQWLICFLLWLKAKDQRIMMIDALQVVAYDFGIKHNILRRLAAQGCRLTVVPADYPAEKVLAMNPDGIFLSNGPVPCRAFPCRNPSVAETRLLSAVYVLSLSKCAPRGGSANHSALPQCKRGILQVLAAGLPAYAMVYTDGVKAG